ncbi:unnamed protein product [Staurois parvus]|uniref:Ribosomal protein L2 n=1 Tax=Staurois parvus TaxID=386267 RepID=A0ABN9HHF3_9NEOB|nr:unnamed protein product [Staurois parvus]
MIGTSYRGPVRRSVFHCVRRTQRALDRGAVRSQGARTARKGGWIIPCFSQDKLGFHLVVNGNGYLQIFFFYYQRKTGPK